MKYWLHMLQNRKVLAVIVTMVFLVVLAAWHTASLTQSLYERQQSVIMYDRYGIPLAVSENSKGHYVLPTITVPHSLQQLLIQKEDRFFYYHLGVNPVSLVRAVYRTLLYGELGGSSTLTQQLTKNLLGTETNRTVINKLKEIWYAISLELFTSKEEILSMYMNSVFLGNQVQGFETASVAYFNKSLAETTYAEQIVLLATLSHPNTRNPWTENSAAYASTLSATLRPENVFLMPKVTDKYAFRDPSYFELSTAGVVCDKTCYTTTDATVTAVVRDILARHVSVGRVRNIRNGAVVILDAKTSELIALVGSDNPDERVEGSQINMAIEPRPIGSTIKPFIYGLGFETGLRPYTLVEDREYKYPIATGYSLYPKNYDGQYRGEVTLHEALSNSLNVPTVKTLEYVGLDSFYTFLDERLQFVPLQPYDSYQYGIALGGLEMDLLTLTHYFTIFPTKGMLRPLTAVPTLTDVQVPSQSTITESVRVFDESYAELVHVVLRDRFTGVNQFGLEGNINLTYDEYGVKTGTSRDFHDSWVVGYTPDFVVGVWLGNAVNEPMSQVSGSSGAGAVWHDVMEYLLSTEYHRRTPYEFTEVVRYAIDGSDEWGLRDDVVEQQRRLLMSDVLILSVHEDDTYELFDELSIPLRARQEVNWFVNGELFDTAIETWFSPVEVGSYEISAFDPEDQTREIVRIHVIAPL